MNVDLNILSDISTLEIEIRKYLNNAGFLDNMFTMEKYDDREYIIVHMCNKGIDYIERDIIKTKWKNILEIKKYDGKIPTAIFIFKF